jgi:hypothetical protein
LGVLSGLVAPAALRQLGSAKEKVAHQSAMIGIGHAITVRQSAGGGDDIEWQHGCRSAYVASGLLAEATN